MASVNGSQVKRIRLARGITQRQLAKLLRVSRGMVNMIENNEPDAKPGEALVSRLKNWIAKGGPLPDEAPRGPYGRG